MTIAQKLVRFHCYGVALFFVGSGLLPSMQVEATEKLSELLYGQ